MGLFDKLPRINAQRFRLNLAKNAALATAKAEVWPVLNEVGESRFRKLIEANQPFCARIEYQKMPDKWRNWIGMAPQYRLIISGIDETFVLALLPDWLQVLVTRDQRSWGWFQGECAWIKSHFSLEAPQKGVMDVK